jgi:hypothetical protein
MNGKKKVDCAPFFERAPILKLGSTATEERLLRVAMSSKTWRPCRMNRGAAVAGGE